MLKELQLKNFRCFNDHTIPFKKLTIIVGKNSAGKSTVVEALRIISHVINKLGNLSAKEPPSWTNLPRVFRGISPSMRSFELFEKNIFHSYGEPPAKIAAKFSTGHRLEIYLGGDGRIHAVLFNNFGQAVTDRKAAKQFAASRFETLPQIGPLQKEEFLLRDSYVQDMAATHLASTHFRNQLNLSRNNFEKFKDLCQSTWPRLRILELQGTGSPESPLSLLVQDGSFVAECAWMGHGLQMWLQTMWFLVTAERAGTVVLDEPDVYLHADLQRKLVRQLRDRDRQTILCTHSIEIMAEAYPDQILVIDRTRLKSEFATTLPVVQSVLNQIGSAANIHLARLWNSKKCILVEGKDVSLLKILQDSLFPQSEEPIDRVPNFSVGGWGGWNKAKGMVEALKESVGNDINTFCIFDSDYFSSDEISKRNSDAKDLKIRLHIWKRKEIENYLVSPIILRALLRKRKVAKLPSLKELEDLIEIHLANLKAETFDSIAAEIHRSHREIGHVSANQSARALLEGRWNTFDGRISVVSGKRLISSLSEHCKKIYGVSFSPTSLARVMKPEYIHSEVVMVITAIEKCCEFIQATQRLHSIADIVSPLMHSTVEPIT